MRAAIINNDNIVINIISADAEYAQSIGAVMSDTANLGDIYVDGVFTPKPVKLEIPQVVTMRQARLALLQAGSLNAVNTAIAGMTGAIGEAARIEWEFSSEVKRNQPLVIALTPTLGFTSQQLDDLFILAATL